MPNDPPEEVQRWTAKRRMALVVSILKGDVHPTGDTLDLRIHRDRRHKPARQGHGSSG